MIDVVFISDLHLHPQNPQIQARFNQFLSWVKSNSIKQMYILGDFFHVWAGDDALDAWSKAIALQLYELKQGGCQIFYMHGNRDFLLGPDFAKRAGWTVLPDPTPILLGNEPVLLSHGDSYCTKDTAHQRFRRLTRNRIFTWLFLKLPLSYRIALVNKVRQISQEGKEKTMEQMDVVPESVKHAMKVYHVNTLIHGHTHHAGLTTYHEGGVLLKRYVMSDWDDIPVFLCYDNTKGVYLNQQSILEV